MELIELLELKAEYEKELLLAEAKVAVITDIIHKAESKNQEAEYCVTETESCISEEVAQEQTGTEGY